MIVSIIAAVGNNRVIGRNNSLPWKLPADMEHFRKLTIGKPIIMGRRTFESIGEPLSGRMNIVLTDDNNFQPPGCLIAYSVEQALNMAGEQDEVMIIGGASVYRQFLPLASRMYLTLIKKDFVGDAYFPEFDPNEWFEVEHQDYEPDENNHYQYSFVTLQKK